MMPRALVVMQNSAAALMLATLLSSSSQPGILAPVIASVCISNLMGSCLTAVYAITAKNKAIVSPDAQRSPEPEKPPTPPAATQQMAEALGTSTPSVPPQDDAEKLPPWVIRKGAAKGTDEKSTADTNHGEAAKARAWIEAWRTKQVEEASRANDVAPEAPVAPDVITIESVSASMQTGGSPDTADVIAEAREKQVADAKVPAAPAAPVAPTRPDGAQAAEVRAWIAAWRARQAAPVEPAASQAAEVRAWISAWRARQAAPVEPASQAKEKSAPLQTQAPMQPKATRSKEQAESSKVSASVRKEKKLPVTKAGPDFSKLFPTPKDTKESLTAAASIVFKSLSNGFERVREDLVDYASQTPGAQKLAEEQAEEQAKANAAEARAWIAAWRRNQVEFVLLTTYYSTSYLLPTTCYLLPTTCYLLPTTYYLLPTTYYLLPTTHYPLPTTYYLLLYLLPTAYYLLLLGRVPPKGLTSGLEMIKGCQLKICKLCMFCFD